MAPFELVIEFSHLSLGFGTCIVSRIILNIESHGEAFLEEFVILVEVCLESRAIFDEEINRKVDTNLRAAPD